MDLKWSNVILKKVPFHLASNYKQECIEENLSGIFRLIQSLGKLTYAKLPMSVVLYKSLQQRSLPKQIVYKVNELNGKKTDWRLIPASN